MTDTIGVAATVVFAISGLMSLVFARIIGGKRIHGKGTLGNGTTDCRESTGSTASADSTDPTSSEGSAGSTSSTDSRGSTGPEGSRDSAGSRGSIGSTGSAGSGGSTDQSELEDSEAEEHARSAALAQFTMWMRICYNVLGGVLLGGAILIAITKAVIPIMAITLLGVAAVLVVMNILAKQLWHP